MKYWFILLESLVLLNNADCEPKAENHIKLLENSDTQEDTSILVEKKNKTFLKQFRLKQWMNDLYSNIADKKLKDIVIPGTHDSGTATISENNAVVSHDGQIPSITKRISKSIIKWSKTQNLTIKEQLNIGVRFFDFRISVEENDELYLSHGLRGEKLSEAFSDILNFCLDTDKEIIIIKVKGFSDKKCENRNVNELIADFFKLYKNIILERRNIPNPEKLPSMKLKDILNTGKRIIILFDIRVKKGQTGTFMQETLNNSEWLFDADILESPWANTYSTPELFEYTKKTAKNVNNDKFYALHWTLTANARYIVSHHFSKNKKGGIKYMTGKLNGGKEYKKDYSLSAVLKEVPRINIVEHDFIDEEKTNYLINLNLIQKH